ncbi:uncharacterized protein LOC142167881 [Nicotiana tabacum]|uniref:Uncharacterized protein LOC142167881 n=1 Tax=Nicotiana tabacum TaxID=4097 RepID=A0AC58SHA2_TOBAC
MQHLPDLKNKVKLEMQKDCKICPLAKQQNGVVKRKHRHILDVARALKIQSNIPVRFWRECVRTSVYLINKIPTQVLNKRSPYELLYGKQPSIDHLRVFGCLCYASTLPRGDKFAPRARRAVMIGGDVTFKEDVFPFQCEEACQEGLFILTPVDMNTIVPRTYGDDVPVANQEELSNGSMEKEAIPAESSDADLDESAGVNADIPNASEDVVAEPLAIMEETQANLQEQQAATQQLQSFEPANNAKAPILRKSTRGTKPTIWLKDYITGWKPSGHIAYPISNYATYTHLPEYYQAYLTSFSALTEPNTFYEASTEER